MALPVDLGATSSVFQQTDFPQMPQMAAPGGMFGGGGSWQNALLAALAGFMMRRRPQIAQSILEPLQQGQILRQKLQEAQIERQQRNEDQFGNFQRQYDYELAHPKPQAPPDPGSMDALRAEYLDPNTTPARKAQLEQIVLQPQLMDIPGVGVVAVPRTAPQGAPTAPVGKLRPLGAGGPTPQASGGFPGPGY